MQQEDIDLEIPTPCLSNLDSALHRLGMLSAPVESRGEYFRDLRQKSYLNMVRINTRYVSNVSIGFRVRPVTPHIRYKPYAMKERHRTRSETSDSDLNLVRAVVDEIVETSSDLTQLKKAKSLESIVAESDSGVNVNNISILNCPELETVLSNSIQNLRVVE